MLDKVKKGINIWSFDPSLSIRECAGIAKDAGFDGIELAVALDGELTLDTPDNELLELRRQVEEEGIVISNIVSGLYFQYSISSDIPEIREKAVNLMKRQIYIASLLGVGNVLVCAGLVGVDFKPADLLPDVTRMDYFAGSEVVDYQVVYDRCIEYMKEVASYAGAMNVQVGIEEIWNRFLLSPLEMKRFVEDINSPSVGVHLDTGNMMPWGYPEHWIQILGDKIKMIHFKDYRRAAGNLSGFVDLLAGDVNWPAVYDALCSIDYEGWVTAEMTAYKYYGEQLIYNTSASMDRILRRNR